MSENIDPLLPAEVHFDEQEALRAFAMVWDKLIVRIQGEAWKLSAKVIDGLQKNRFLGLLR